MPEINLLNNRKNIFNILSRSVIPAVDLVDADAEEDDDRHKEVVERELNGHEKSQQYHLRIEDEQHHGMLAEDGKGGDESAEITIPMLRGKNLSLLSNQ